MKKWMIGLLAVLIVGGGIGYYMYEMDEDASDESGKRWVYGDDSLREAQEAVNQTIEQSYSQGDFTLNDPYIVKDPYKRAPLTALVRFETQEPAEISIVVEGKSEGTSVEKTWKGFRTSHSLDILGLYPDTANTIELTARYENGTETTEKMTIQTEPLPEDFLTIELEESNQARMEKGLTFMSPSEVYPFAVDANGDVRWYATQLNSHVMKRLPNGDFLFVTKPQDQYNKLIEMDMMGRVSFSSVVKISNYSGWGVIHHDAVKMPSGNYLMTVHDASGEYIEDSMIEVDEESGEKVGEFNFRSIFPEEVYEDYDGPSADEGDWFHQNALWYDESRDDYLISSRHQSLIMSMDYPSGDVSWVLAEPENWPENFDMPLLEPVGDGDFKYPGGPHAVMPLPDQDSNQATRDILLFDNNIAITRGNEELSEQFSRAVQYRINEPEKTVQEVWSYGRERGKSFYSMIVSDANFLPDTGNRLITSGYTEDEGDYKQSQIVEVTGEEDPQVVFEVNVKGFKEGSHRQIYRSERLPLYPDVK